MKDIDKLLIEHRKYNSFGSAKAQEAEAQLLQAYSDLKAENEGLKNCVNCKIEGGFFDTTKAECMSCKNYSHWQRRAL